MIELPYVCPLHVGRAKGLTAENGDPTMPLIPEKIERRNQSMTCQLKDKYKGENYTDFL
jgi:hypothetical protein